MELGKSKEDYLKAIFILQLKLSTVRSINVAEYLGFSKASVSAAMKQLRSKNYIIMDDGCGLHLSPKGELLASQVLVNTQRITDFRIHSFLWMTDILVSALQDRLLWN